ncbi:serine/threonine-protein kinase [Agrilutibacter solisilvae]|uniref:Serine/threonine protein kinase n=1 Tax=Agrilutibacter solisilvae TaxID=2763317 RepID=A0A975AT42_9GAMM|nr:serine/threonine-protein kinase [Lysobacter solisilvae]QSX78729.1 serine/threonine protein kinase [Lysobacter solisilvae]
MSIRPPSDTDLSQRALALFDDLLDLDDAPRQARLDRLAADDPALHARVRALLRADAHAAGVLEHRPETLFPDAGDEPDDGLVGHRIGPWRIMGIVGRGGMGAVYRGERADGEFRQAAAIKLIRRGLDRPELRRRFLRERQILAQLRHPNIATLLDGGVTEQGAPYFAMEFIDGLPIDAWCEEHRADLPTRVRLFLQVCHAVQHAHQNLTVHRDLKPSNILVTPDGQARLLDFGIAKLLEDDAEDADGTTVDRPFTPEYAAPEQLRGEAVTTATDLYSLGVVLYALLAGTHPLGITSRAAARSPAALLGREPESLPRAAQRIEPEAALTRGLSPKGLAEALRGDLAAILHRCLQPDPARRYASAEALGQDLKAWLDGRAVSATRGERVYRLRKFAWRNRYAVSAGLAAFAAIGIALALALWQAREARVQARHAQANAQAAQNHARNALSTRNFAVSLLSSASPLKSARGTQTTAVELLQAAAQRVDNELGQAPESQAELRATIGASLYQLGDRDGGIALIERGLAQMEELRLRGLPRVEALQARAIARRESGDDDGAERDVRAALAQLAGVGGDQRLQRIKLRTLLSTITTLRGRLHEALALNRDTLADRTALLGKDHEETAVDWNNLANAHLRVDECALAQSGFEHADAILVRHKGVDFPRRVWPLMGVAAARMCRGDAIALAGQALDEAERVMLAGLGADHPISVSLLANRGSVQLRQGDPAGAQRFYEQALAKARVHHDANLHQLQSQLGISLLQQGRTQAALVHLVPAVEAMAHDRVTSEPALNRAQAALGRARFLAGQQADGEREIRAVLDRLTKAGFAATDDYGEAANDLAYVLAASGRTVEAATWQARAYATLVRVYGATHPRTRALAPGVAKVALPVAAAVR